MAYQQEIKELLQKYAQTEAGSRERFVQLYHIIHFSALQDYALCQKYLPEGKAMARKGGFVAQEFSFLHLEFYWSHTRGDYAQAEQTAQEIIDFLSAADEKNDKQIYELHKLTLFSALSVMLKDKTAANQALQYSLKHEIALRAQKGLKKERLMALYEQLAICYDCLGDYHRALYYIELAIKTQAIMGTHEKVLCNVYELYTQVLFRAGLYAQCLEVGAKGMALSQQHAQLIWAECAYYTSSAGLKMGETQGRYAHLQQALAIGEQFQHWDLQARVHQELGDYHAKMADFRAAYEHNTRATALISEHTARHYRCGYVFLENLLRQHQFQQKISDTTISFLPQPSEQEAEAAFVNQLNYIIQANLFSPNFNIEQLAIAAKCSVRTLSRRFLRLFQQSPAAFLLDIKIECAKGLLQQSVWSAQEVSDLLGFSSSSYFVKVFKDKTGQTPQNFKRNQEEKAINTLI